MSATHLMLANKYELEKRLRAVSRYTSLPLSDLITDIAGELDALLASRDPVAKTAADRFETDGLGALLDELPHDSYSTRDSGATTEFIFEDGSVMTLTVSSAVWRSA